MTALGIAPLPPIMRVCAAADTDITNVAKPALTANGTAMHCFWDTSRSDRLRVGACPAVL